MIEIPIYYVHVSNWVAGITLFIFALITLITYLWGDKVSIWSEGGKLTPLFKILQPCAFVVTCTQTFMSVYCWIEVILFAKDHAIPYGPHNFIVYQYGCLFSTLSVLSSMVINYYCSNGIRGFHEKNAQLFQ